MKQLSLFLFGAMLSAPSLFAAEPAKLSPEQLEFFESKIRPVLVEHCYQCHSTESEKLKGGLLLDSREGWQTTGDSGPSILPGQPDDSLLVIAMAYEDEDMEMPPKKRLPPEVVADFRRWVEMGAPDPRNAPSGGVKIRNVLYEAKDAESHWSFQPLAAVEVPEIDSPWVQSPIDAFLLKQMQEADVEPSAAAEPRALIRRASYDLTGLPPTMEEVAEFEAAWNQDASQAMADLTERLLASPQYGVKYGRHWLDLARYADTNGNRQAPTAPSAFYPYAWTYRDWVIEAFNADMPYDQFILQQLAADQTGLGEDPEALRAMGFLRVGKIFGQNMDDRIDDRIDAMSKTFQGLTVACARCHDHKFDPVYQSDYYALHGIFSSTEDVDIELEEPSTEFVALTEKTVADARALAREKINDYISDFVHRSADFMMAAQAFRDGGLKESQPALAAREVNLKPIQFEAFIDALEYWKQTENRVMTPWFAYAEADEADYPKVTQQIQSGAIATNPLVAARFATAPQNLREVAERYQQLSIDTEAKADGMYPLTELIVTLVKVQRNWRHDEYDPFANTPRSLDDPDWEELRTVLMGFEGAWGGDRMPPQMLSKSGAGDFKGKIQTALQQVQRMSGELPGAPVKAMGMQDLAKPVNSPIYIRGSADNPGEEVPRAFLAHLAGPEAAPYKDGSGRLQLAHDIANRENPLTARVLVNRVWQWHFGTGLVTTPSDFGLNGTPPTHPELLDWLATWFMEDADWSIKELHRLIMNSSVYQLSAAPRPELADIDPGNTLLWRFPPRRLTFEELRDSILTYSGELNAAHLSGRPDKTENSVLRTAFLYIDRMDVPYQNQIFDFPNPDFSSAERESAIVPQQALFFLNSPWVMERAAETASRSTGPFDSRLRDLYHRLYQRDPSPQELDLAKHFLEISGEDWTRLTHALLSSNELMFLH